MHVKRYQELDQIVEKDKELLSEIKNVPQDEYLSDEEKYDSFGNLGDTAITFNINPENKIL